ncbi:DUF5518 domain-containing protein [Halobium palmae]|uniref:DUF5518 domain-containing protein n=1 Tax=Halobium palmae TaxID=1776492 RepID=A0ABD5RVK1_9EURY
MVPSPLQPRTLSPAWRFALIGALASLPITVVVNRQPDSEATIGGGIMIIGAFVAGVIAASRSTDPAAAGLRAGFLGGVTGVFTLVLTVVGGAVSGTTATWPLSRVMFWTFAVGLVLCLAPIFGLVCGRAGGWVTNTVASGRLTDTNAS